MADDVEYHTEIGPRGETAYVAECCQSRYPSAETLRDGHSNGCPPRPAGNVVEFRAPGFAAVNEADDYAAAVDELHRAVTAAVSAFLPRVPDPGSPVQASPDRHDQLTAMAGDFATFAGIFDELAEQLRASR